MKVLVLFLTTSLALCGQKLSCSDTEIDNARKDLDFYQQKVEMTENYLRSCGASGGNGQAQCMNYVMDRGYGIDTAKATCAGMSYAGYECVKYIMDKGYGTEVSRNTCLNITSGESKCLKTVMNHGYGIETSKNTCQNVSIDQADCIGNVMNHGYSPDTARNNCVSKK